MRIWGWMDFYWYNINIDIAHTRKSYVKSHTFDPWNGSHWFLPQQRTCFVLMLWMHIEMLLKHLFLYIYCISTPFYLWISHGGTFVSHKSFTRIIPAKETTVLNFWRITASPTWASKLKACTTWKFYGDSCILALGWALPMIKTCSYLSLRNTVAFNVYLRLLG